MGPPKSSPIRAVPTSILAILMPWADASLRVYSALDRFVRKRLETGVLGGIEAAG